ncbi:MAG: hypothetical protein J3K34DRAFT_412915 [Monoraphidium minutum]|nr:MAG: hypothetical protein J3K34DRAFT_412915 [Monoraphidium minutum]
MWRSARRLTMRPAPPARRMRWSRDAPAASVMPGDAPGGMPLVACHGAPAAGGMPRDRHVAPAAWCRAMQRPPPDQFPCGGQPPAGQARAAARRHMFHISGPGAATGAPPALCPRARHTHTHETAARFWRRPRRPERPAGRAPPRAPAPFCTLPASVTYSCAPGH